MKNTIIAILVTNLSKVQDFINEHRVSLLYVINHKHHFHNDAQSVLEEKIYNAEQEEAELLNCIEYLNKLKS